MLSFPYEWIVAVCPSRLHPEAAGHNQYYCSQNLWRFTSMWSVEVLKKKAIGHLTSKPVVACDVAMCARARTETHWAELYYSSRCYFDITSLRNSKSEWRKGGKMETSWWGIYTLKYTSRSRFTDGLYSVKVLEPSAQNDRAFFSYPIAHSVHFK